MGFSFKRFKKSLKKATRSAAKVLKHVAAPLGAIVGGPLGAAAGTAIAGGLSQVGPNKDRAAALQRTLVSGAAVTAGTAGLGLLSGAGIGAPLYQSAEALVGAGPGAAPSSPAAPENGMVFSYNKPAAAAAGQTGSPLETALKVATAAAGVPSGMNAADLQRQYQQQLALAEKLASQGDTTGAAEAAALAESYRQQLEALGQSPGSGGFQLSTPVVLVGLAALLLLSRKKAA